jgi:hypothetical protein
MTRRTYIAQAGAPKTASPAKPGWKCSHCQGSGKRRRIVIRRRKRDVYDEVKAKVMAIQAMKDPGWSDRRVTKEQLAVDLGVTEDCVVQALHRLNLEGLVYRRSNKAPHDSKREYPDPDFRGRTVGDASWQGSTYLVRGIEDRKEV